MLPVTFLPIFYHFYVVEYCRVRIYIFSARSRYFLYIICRQKKNIGYLRIHVVLVFRLFHLILFFFFLFFLFGWFLFFVFSLFCNDSFAQKYSPTFVLKYQIKECYLFFLNNNVSATWKRKLPHRLKSSKL